MPKPAHLTWEEAASPGLVNSTAYRQLISKNGAGDEARRPGPDLGRLRRPRVLRHPDGAGRWRDPHLRRLLAREGRRSAATMGAELIIDRSAEGYRFWNDDDTAQDPREWQRLGKQDPRAHRRPRRRHRLRAPGPRDLRRQRLRRAQGRHHRHLRVDVGLHARVRQPLPVDEPQADHRLSHFANYREAWEANELINRGLIHPTLSKTYAMDEVGQAALDVHRNAHQGKVGVLDPLARGRASASPTPRSAAAAPRRDQPLPQRLTCTVASPRAVGAIGSAHVSCSTGGASSGARQRDALRASNHPPRSPSSRRTGRPAGRDPPRPTRRRAPARTGRRSRRPTRRVRGCRVDQAAPPGRRGGPRHRRAEPRPRGPDDGRRYGRAGSPLNRQSPFYMGFVGAHRRAHRAAAVEDPRPADDRRHPRRRRVLPRADAQPARRVSPARVRRGGAVAVVFAGAASASSPCSASSSCRR